MSKNNQIIEIDDVISFFMGLGASNELSKHDFDTGDFYSEEYCNRVVNLAKKYGLYDELEDARNVNYIVDLEDDLTDFFRKQLDLLVSNEK